MKKENAVIVGLAVLAAVAAAVWLLFVAPALTVDQPRGVISQATDHYGLHIIMLWVCVIISMCVFTAMLASIVVHRRVHRRRVKKFSRSACVEIIWALVPILILIGMALPAASKLLHLQDSSPQLPMASVKVLPLVR